MKKLCHEITDIKKYKIIIVDQPVVLVDKIPHIIFSFASIVFLMQEYSYFCIELIIKTF